MKTSVTGKRQATKRKSLEPLPSSSSVPKLIKLVPPTSQIPTNAKSDLVLTPPTAEWNFKISSWNVGGLRAVVKKDGMKFIELEKPDIMCLQVCKCKAYHVNCKYMLTVANFNVGNQMCRGRGSSRS